MGWEQELEATRAKVESLGGCDTSAEASAIMDCIDELLLDLKRVVMRPSLDAGMSTPVRDAGYLDGRRSRFEAGEG